MSFDPRELTEALERVDELGDERARAAARAAVTRVLEFHRAGLARLFEIAAREPGESLLERAAEDELAGSLLALHDLAPQPRERDVQAAPRQPAPPASDLVPVDRLLTRPGDHGPRCELCAGALRDGHAHVLDVEARTLACACEACSTVEGGRYRRLRSHVRPLVGVDIADEAWNALGVPVGLAFLARESTTGKLVASYPGPGGAVAATVDDRAWSALVAAAPVLSDIEPDVEALLVDRLRDPPRYYHCSMDHCYRLVGLVRSRWRGISGGPGVPEAIAAFFAAIDAAPEPAHGDG